MAVYMMSSSVIFRGLREEEDSQRAMVGEGDCQLNEGAEEMFRLDFFIPLKKRVECL